MKLRDRLSLNNKPVPATGREPAPRLAAGGGHLPVVETNAVSQFHLRASLLNTRCRSPFGLGGGATPASFAASSAIA